MLQSADKLLAPAVEATLQALELTDADTALVKLTRRYAAAIDADGDRLARLGPPLLAALTSLGATPAARARLPQGGGRAGENRLRALREARR